MIVQSTPLWVRVLAGAAGGALSLVSFPPFSLWPLAWCGLALGLWSLRGASFPRALLIGAAFGAALFFPLVTWTSPFLGPLPWLALASAETLLTAVASVLIAAAYRWAGRSAKRPSFTAVAVGFAVASMVLARELILGNFPYSGFPWARIAMSQSNSPVAPAVSWVSISGLSLLIAFSAALVLEAVVRRRLVLLTIPAGIALALALVPVFPTTPNGLIRIAAVQPNSKAGFFDERGRYDQVEALVAASAAIEPGSVDLVVWPEGFDGDPFIDPFLAQTLLAEVDRHGAPLLSNAAVNRGELIFNTSLLWVPGLGAFPDLAEVQSHAKRNPVPFGEYVPDRAFYAMLVPDLIGLVQREYTPGTDAPLVDVPLAAESVRIALAICFDVIYDEVIREGIFGGGELFVFQTNNADFRGTPESEQQLAFARMRAFETGRSVVNISTIGTSAIIDPAGVITQQLPADVQGVLTANVERRTGVTPGVVVARWVQWGAVAGGLALIVSGAFRSRREP